MANKFRIQDGIISQGEGIFGSVKTPSVSYSGNIDLNITGVEFVGYIDDGFGGNPGATLHVTSVTSGTIIDGMTIYGAGLPVEGWTLTFGTVMAPQGSGGSGNYYLSGANLLISSQTFNGPPSKSWSFQSDGKLALPPSTDSDRTLTVNSNGITWKKTTDPGSYQGYISWTQGSQSFLDAGLNYAAVRHNFDYGPVLRYNTVGFDVGGGAEHEFGFHGKFYMAQFGKLLVWNPATSTHIIGTSVGIRAESEGNYQHDWVFQDDGKLALPAGGDIVDSTGTSVLGGGGSGTQGIQGLQGADGVQGITGADGLQGLPGIDGSPGAPGMDGSPGSPGIDGAPGADGVQGIAGAQGTQGLQGLIGPVAGSDTQVIFNDSSTAGASSNLTFNKSTNLLTVTGNVSVTGTDSNIIRRAFGLVATDTYVTLDDIKAKVTSSSQLSLMLVSGSWQGTGWTETFQGGGTPAVNNWVNLPLSSGFDTASGAMPNQGNGCRCVISDQTPSAKVYQINVVRSGTTGAMWNISIERLV